MAIKHIVREYENLERDIKALTWVLLCVCIVIVYQFLEDFYNKQQYILTDLAPLIAVLVGLLISTSASRVLVHNNLTREIDRRQEMEMVIYHLIGITQDLEQKVNHVRGMFMDRKSSVFVVQEISLTIERRYEALFEQVFYKYLPGKAVDLIHNMSGHIFGLRTFATRLEKNNPDQADFRLESVISEDDRIAKVKTLEKMTEGISSLVDCIYEIRKTLDGSKLSE